LVRDLGPSAELVKIEQLSASYRFDLPRFDQTLTPVAECGVELIVRKRPAAEVNAGGRLNKSQKQPDREVRLHLNQYRDDMAMMKKFNQDHSPFQNDSEI